MEEFRYDPNELIIPKKDPTKINVFYSPVTGDILGFSTSIPKEFTDADYIQIEWSVGEGFFSGEKDPSKYLVTINDTKRDLVRRKEYRVPGKLNGLFELKFDRVYNKEKADVFIKVKNRVITIETVPSDEKFTLYVTQKNDPTILIQYEKIEMNEKRTKIKVNIEDFSLIVDNDEIQYYLEVLND